MTDLCEQCQKRGHRLASWRLEIGRHGQFADSAPRICAELERDISECCGLPETPIPPSPGAEQ